MEKTKELLYRPIIGMELHVELKTESKMFCSCKGDYFGREPNTEVCPVCLGLPGALPYPNSKAIEWCIMLGLALDCDINKESYFERKNYFYPDLPKGYQISQYKKPFCQGGKLILSTDKKIRINRVHQEEDTGKLTHAKDVTLIDFNRSGVPLVEIVTEPDFTSTEEIKEYAEKIQRIVRAIGVSDADMEKGTMRLEPTVNLEIREGEKLFFTPLVELKNINSFRFAKKAVEYEIKRQLEEFRKNRTVKTTGNKTTRGYDEDSDTTFPQREKEEANDYRYFPEPDIPIFYFSNEKIAGLKEKIPELPEERQKRLVEKYGLTTAQATFLGSSKEKASFFEKAVEEARKQLDALKALVTGSTKSNGESQMEIYRLVANWLINSKVDINIISPEQFVKENLERRKIQAFSKEELGALVKRVIDENQKAAGDYTNGKIEALGFLIGRVKGIEKNADAEAIKRTIIELLAEKNN